MRGVDELPPPQPMANHVPANKAAEKRRPRPKSETLPRRLANAASSIPGAQKAAAGSTGELPFGRGLNPRHSALLPAVCIVTTVVCGPLVVLSVSVPGWKLQLAFWGRFWQENCRPPT